MKALALLAVWPEWHCLKQATTAGRKRRTHRAKRGNRKGFEQTTQTAIVREGFLEEETSMSRPVVREETRKRRKIRKEGPRQQNKHVCCVGQERLLHTALDRTDFTA